MTTWVSRSQWGARPPKSTRPLTGFTSGWFIHWLGEPAAAGLGDETVLRNTQRYHMDSKAWADIAYSFAVGRQHPDRAYELRGWGVAGGHTEGHNSQSMAIVFLLGTGERPTDEMLATARAIIAEGITRGYPSDLVRPHNAVRSTACPGPDLTAWVNAGRFTTTRETTTMADNPGARIQRAINANGLQPPLKVDGECGPATASGLDSVLAYLNGQVADLRQANKISADTIKRLTDEVNDWRNGARAEADLANQLKAERDTAMANREAAEAEVAMLRRELHEGGRIGQLLADLDAAIAKARA